MLIPRYSIRTYFVATIILAILSVTLSYALEGRHWARGVMIGVMGGACALALYAVFFAISWAFAERYIAKNAPQPQSPFAGKDPPQQVFPPVEL